MSGDKAIFPHAPRVGTFGVDLRHAGRILRKNPGFTAVAVAALALGIGANTAIFTVVDTVLLEPLPYREPDRLVLLGQQLPTGVQYATSIPKYMAWRNNEVFERMTLYDGGRPLVNLGSADRPDQVPSTHVSKDFFDVFGAPPALGRSFTAAEDLPSGGRVAVISHHLWQTRFAGDPRIVGRVVRLNREPYTVVGVLAGSFRFTPSAEIWLPLQADPNSDNQGDYLAVAARLKRGVTVASAQAQMKLVADRFRQAHPKLMDKNESVAVVPMRDGMVRDAKTPLYVLLGAVALVLLIASANVANLLLARAASRQREMAIRAAIGASRVRVLRQLLTESLLLAGLGGALGFALGTWGVRTLLLLVPGSIPRLATPDGQPVIPPLDWRIALFTLGVALLTGILFGLFPALQLSSPDLSVTLKESGGRSGSSVRHARVRSLLVVTEVALALVLLIGAALLIRTFVGLHTVDPGIDPHHVLTLATSMASGNYATTAKVDAFLNQVVRRLEALPGVEGAAISVLLPAGNADIDLPFTIAGKPPAKGSDDNGDEQWRSVSPHYFRVFRIPVLRGRVFDEGDRAASAHVVVINDVLARKYWPNENPLGQVITIGKSLGPQFAEPPREVVGVVGNVRETGLSEKDVPVMYVPQSQVPDGLTKLANAVIPLEWVIRTTPDPMTMRAPVEREIRAVDDLLPIAQERSMEEYIAVNIGRQRFTTLLLAIFAGIALLLASIGIYGLMSYSVAQRTQEIGIRAALGAGRAQLLRLVLMHGLKLAGAGLAIGLALAYGLTRVLGTLLFGVSSTDPATFAAGPAILAAIATVAAYLPARRAAAIEPADALRHE